MTSEKLLERAESFFKKKNYRLAKTLFEQCPISSCDLFFAKKIEICTQELNKEKAKNLTKKARRLLKKNRSDQALEYFKEAYVISGEEWIKRHIEKLEGKKNHEHLLAEAEKAEFNGNTSQAAELYKKLFENDAKPALLLRFLFNLSQSGTVKKNDISSLMENHNEALSVISEFSEKQVYELGYVLVKTEQYSDALEVWSKVHSSHPKFIEQKNAVLYLREKQIYHDFLKTNDYETYLSVSKDFLEYSASPTVADIARLCNIKRAELLFQKQKFRSALNLLLPFPRKMDLEDVHFYSKIYFNIVKYADDADALDVINLCEFAFTALFNEHISGAYYHNEDEFETVNEKITSEIIKLNKKYAQFSVFYVFFLVVVMRKLKQIFNNTPNSKLVLSPKIAFLLGKCREINLKCDECLKNKNEDETKNLSDDKVIDSFKYLFNPEFQNRLYEIYRNNDNIDSLRNDMKKIGLEIHYDFFFKLYLELALIAYCENNFVSFERYFANAAPALSDKSLLTLISKLLPADSLSLDIVSGIDKTLAPMANKSDYEEYVEMCSRYTLRKIILQFNEGKIKPSILKAQIEKILSKIELSEFQDEIDAVYEEADIEKIAEFFGKRKLRKAAEIAKESRYSEPENFFFEQIVIILTSTLQFEPDCIPEMAGELYKYAHYVDPVHEITKQLAELKM